MPRRRHVPRAWCARRGRAPAARVEAIVEPSSFCSSRPHSVSTCGGGLQPCGTRTTRAPRAHHDCRAHGARVGQRAQLHERATCALTLPTRSGRASRTLHSSRLPNLSPPHIHTHNGARSTPPVIDGESEGLTPYPMPCSYPSRAQRQGLLIDCGQRTSARDASMPTAPLCRDPPTAHLARMRVNSALR